MIKRRSVHRVNGERAEKAGLRRFAWTAAAAIALVTLLIWGAATGLSVLERICGEQCRLGNADEDVTVVSNGKMIQPDTVRFFCGLTNGAPLAEIDFAEIRAKMLARFPVIREIRFERRMPARLRVEITEREAIARVACGRKGRANDGRVADAEGVVFPCFTPETSMLPVVREPGSPDTKPGGVLTGNAAAALQLIAATADPEFAELRVLDVDATQPDFILVTFSDYERARLAWEKMGTDGTVSRSSLGVQLSRLNNCIRSSVAPRQRLWTAVDWGPGGRVYAGEQPRTRP